MMRPASVGLAAAMTIAGSVVTSLIASLILLNVVGMRFASSQHHDHLIEWLAVGLSALALGVMGLRGGWSAWKGRSRTILLAVAGVHLALGVSAFVYIWRLYSGGHHSSTGILGLFLFVVLLAAVSYGMTVVFLILMPPSADFFHAERHLADRAARPNAAPKSTSKVKCAKCRQVQPVPRDQSLFVCEECGAQLKRRTAPALSTQESQDGDS